MRIEAVTVCVGYADFLAATLPENLPLVDDLVVVTSPDDEETRAVCRKHNVFHILSEDYRRGGPFNKARMINRAFDQIGCHDWVLHLDADIVMPRQFRRLVDWADLDERVLYGADRQRIIGFDEWKAFKQYVDRWDNHTHEMGWWFHPKYPMMSRTRLVAPRVHADRGVPAFPLVGIDPVQLAPTAVPDRPRRRGPDRSPVRPAMGPAVPGALARGGGPAPGERARHARRNWSGRTTKRFGPELKLVEDRAGPSDTGTPIRDRGRTRRRGPTRRATRTANRRTIGRRITTTLFLRHPMPSDKSVVDALNAIYCLVLTAFEQFHRQEHRFQVRYRYKVLVDRFDKLVDAARCWRRHVLNRLEELDADADSKIDPVAVEDDVKVAYEKTLDLLEKIAAAIDAAVDSAQIE